MHRKHVIILMPDQWRADCFSGAGHPVVKTPAVDELMKEGVRFERAYTMCPICMPARSSFLSGMYCHNHGQWSNYGQLPAGADTYAKRLKAAGYWTCQVGKSHLYGQGRGQHLETHKGYLKELGFDEAFEVTGPLATEFTNSIMTDSMEKLGILQTFREDYAKRRTSGVHALWPSPLPPGQTLDDFVGRTAVEYLEGYRRPEPLMLFVGFPGPHDPWDPPKDWAAKYEPMAMDKAKPVAGPGPWVPAAAAEHQRQLQSLPEGVTDEVIDKTRALYYAKISHIDDWVGKIVEALKARGMWDDAILIFWSDHGEMLWDKGRLHKQVFYEESARVPLIIRTAETSQRGGTVARGLVSLMDVYPTLLDLAGCSPEPGKAGEFGKSLAPILERPQTVLNDAVFSEIGMKGRSDRQTMVRDDRYKMVVNKEGLVLELYDMVEDGAEAVNLVGREGTDPIIASMKDRLLRWLLATPNGAFR